MLKKLIFNKENSDLLAARIGGPAMIGGIQGWPLSPTGEELTLLMSLPAMFLKQYTNVNLPQDMIVSVFSYYSTKNYFLDTITYHGCLGEELDVVKQYTRVMIHQQGEEVYGGVEVPQRNMSVEEIAEDEQGYNGSKIDGNPEYLQAEEMDFTDCNFILQVYGGDFPEPFRDIFYLSDGVGYLFLPVDIESSKVNQAGLFFAQVT